MVRPPKHKPTIGYWMKDDSVDYEPKPKCVCSNCKSNFFELTMLYLDDLSDIFEFCPNCGAWMYVNKIPEQ